MSIFGLAKTLLGANLAESFIDNVIRDKVSPKIGSVVYCEMAFGAAEHSGIYVGDGKIVELSGDGIIRKVSAYDFMDSKIPTARSIYVSSQKGRAIGSEKVAERALKMVGSRRDYNIIMDNCHQFSAGCLTGDFNNSNNFLWMLKHEAEKRWGSLEWRVWDR